MMPAVLKIEGWEEQVELTEKWLQGKFEIPEIADKWANGPIVTIALQAPERIDPGDDFNVQVILTSNKVGHDFPTGPLDIIQSWVELHVYDDEGNEVFATGERDERNFIEEGSFLFKAEPVDQYGNLIDRHNLWEMVGVRFRRALFPGYSDTVEYVVDCMGSTGVGEKSELARTGEEVQEFEIEGPGATGKYQVVASLQYRKVDQFLINFLLGEDSGLSAPVVEMARVTASVNVSDADQQTEVARALPVVPAGG